MILRVTTLAIVAVLCACNVQPRGESLNTEITGLVAPELRRLLATGQLSAEAMTNAFLQRMESIDDAGPTVNAIIEVNPQALAIARDLDRAFARSGPIGSLHGVPVVLKANIDTGDEMATSAGSLALANHHARDDAVFVARLRQAGAVIIAKSNLSEWANFRSKDSISGWSSIGGQTHNAYVLDRNPCGSSSGSAVAVAARLAPLAVGTETDGSVVCPASINGVVGIKPTIGLIEQDGIIPIAASQDTGGPMARTVAGAALLLSAMADPNAGSDSYAVTNTDLNGARIGVVRDYFGAGTFEDVDDVYSSLLSILSDAGAELVDPILLEVVGESRDAEIQVLLYEFKAGLNQYLAESDAPIPTLDSLIAFNEENADTVMPLFGQDIFQMATETGGLGDEAYLAALANSGDYMRNLLDSVFGQHDLDALVALSNGPAWKTDAVYGDRIIVSSSAFAAISGYPSITVPGRLIKELPVALSFIGQAHQEPRLIDIAAAFEGRRGQFPPPRFLPSLEADP